VREIIKDFVRVIVPLLPFQEPIYEFGSLQVAGQEGFADLRPFFPGKQYVGCDMRPGPGVDCILNLHNIELPDGVVGTVLVMDTLEHVEFVRRAMDEVYRILKPGGFVVISSVMNFPIHDYPFDYWRFTPEGFKSLLQKFGYRFVEWVGHPRFPHTVVGVGCKGELDHSTKVVFEREVARWKERWSLPAATSSVTAEKRREPAGYYSYSRPEVRNLIVPGCSKVLDVGCGEGNLGKALKEERDCEVWGVEINPRVAEVASDNLDKVIVGDYEKIVEDLPSGYFDCVIFADVLEHFVDPWGALKKTKRILKNGGQIVASVPNVRHWSVIKALLEGKWEYQEAGILDRTHLRFFTASSLVRMFKEIGFNIEGLYTTSLRGEEIPIGLIGDLRKWGLSPQNLQEESRVYQYLVSATKKDLPRLTSIIILTLNNLEYTRKCLDSIRKYTPEPHEIIVVDNGSTDGTVEYLKQELDVRLIENGCNLGFALGNNRGLLEAKGDYVVFLNNDVVVTEGWLKRLIACAESDPRVGIVGPRSNYVAGRQMVRDIPYGDDLEAMQEFARGWSQRHSKNWEEALRVIGFCMLVKREVIEKIGGFDPRFGLGNFEDDDFCIRAQIAGFKIKIAHDVFVHHFGSKTFQSEQIDYRRLMLSNWEKFKGKWGLPKNLSIENGYRLDFLLQDVFNPEKHVVPLRIEPYPLDEIRSMSYLAPFSKEALRWYLNNFSPQDAVTLVLYDEGKEEVILQKVSQTVLELGFDPENSPDILIVPGPLDELKQAQLISAVYALVELPGVPDSWKRWAAYLGKTMHRGRVQNAN